MISLSIGLTEFPTTILAMMPVIMTSRHLNFDFVFVSLHFQRKLSIGTNSDPETTLDTTGAADADKVEKKKKKKRKKDAEADETEQPTVEEQPAADGADDDEAAKKEKKKKKKKDKNKDKSDE